MYRFYRIMYGLVGFSRSQTNGFLIFLPLTLCVVFSEPVYRYWKTFRPLQNATETRKLDSLIAILEERPVGLESGTSSPVMLTFFDPNTVSQEELSAAGLKKELVTRIINYRSKGGRFFRREDLLRIYGFDSAVYNKISPYVRIAKATYPKAKNETRSFTPKPVVRNLVLKDINKADTADLKKMFGIGEKLSLRILKYRDALGGFVSMDQLKEVYKLDTAVIQTLKKRFYIAEGFVPSALHVNAAERQELATHPYLSGRVADAIVAYRFQHGQFKSIEELRKIPAMDSVTYRKAILYLKL